MHVGHVLNAIYVWGVTRAAGGRILLRVEDHDRRRSRARYERDLLDDLEWLGFIPDEPSLDEFRRGPCGGRQSDRGPLYREVLADLAARRLVYACECSRSDIAASARDPGGELPYPGTCAEKKLPLDTGLGLRLRLGDDIERFVDLRHGPLEQQPSQQCGDVLIRDRDGNWTYQFAVTVDDFRQGVTVVIRGDDLLASTGRQIQLARLIGRRDPPRFLHHPLIMKSPTQKLSKADRDTSIRDLRDGRATPADVIGQAAHLGGLLPAFRPLDATEAAALVACKYVDACTNVGARRGPA
jgi:glutamyl-tRNA synthetase/glutamyl-Q tRNA(Asp) synthetase